jgi:hypothetical protein
MCITRPAQFEGRVWIDRETQSVDAFQLALPSRNTNVDINVHTRADIGFVPRMELVGGDPHGAREQAWESEISEAGARDTLARRFHRFAQIDWIPFDQALARAQETHGRCTWSCCSARSTTSPAEGRERS